MEEHIIEVQDSNRALEGRCKKLEAVNVTLQLQLDDRDKSVALLSRIAKERDRDLYHANVKIVHLLDKIQRMEAEAQKEKESEKAKDHSAAATPEPQKAEEEPKKEEAEAPQVPLATDSKPQEETAKEPPPEAPQEAEASQEKEDAKEKEAAPETPKKGLLPEPLDLSSASGDSITRSISSSGSDYETPQDKKDLSRFVVKKTAKRRSIVSSPLEYVSLLFFFFFEPLSISLALSHLFSFLFSSPLLLLFQSSVITGRSTWSW